MELVLNAPEDIHDFRFTLGIDEQGDPTGTVNLRASAPTLLRLNHVDQLGNDLRLRIDSLPSELTDGSFTITTCGLDAKLDLSSAVHFLSLVRLATTSLETASTSHITDGCPRGPHPGQTRNSGSTNLFAYLEQIPQGLLELEFKSGSGAGRVKLGPLSEPIGRLEVTTDTKGEKSTLCASNSRERDVPRH